MIQPVEMADFFATFFSAALVILAGAGYALLFAWSRIHRRPSFMPWAYAAYAVLFAAVMVLMRAAHLHGPFWTVVVLLMLGGYFWAPRFIYRLCVATHTHDSEATSSPSSHRRSTT